jgi:choline-glycine betaine transporter
VFKTVLAQITGKTGWFLVLVTNLFIMAALYFALGKFGKIRIDGKDAVPEFSTVAWYSMLLSAGMGIGLLFWSAGLATSLRLCVQQINAGLFHLFGMAISTTSQVVLIAFITSVATLSVIAGLDSGVKLLSQLNMVLAVLFLFFLLLVGPTIFILDGFTQNLGFYLTILPELTLLTETLRGTNWQASWTLFYWAWWIFWSPFVGMFIARISKGRTVRKLLFGVILIPTRPSFIWMSVLGSTALYLQTNDAVDLVSAVNDDVATAMS